MSTTKDVVSKNPVFSLHPSDNPGAILVTSLLNGENYTMWSRAMIKALSAKNKSGFVNGTIAKPSASDASFGLWKQCDDMVASWIVNAVTPEIAGDAIYAETARDLWADLEERFSQINGPRIFELQRKMSSISQGHDSITVYYSKLKSLWDELNVYSPAPPCSCDSNKTFEAYRDRDRTMQFLMGLNETYTTVRGQILLMNPIPAVGKVFSLILQEERQRGIISTRPTTMSDSTALAAKGNNWPGKFPRQNTPNGPKPSCDYCGKVGYIKEKGYKLHGYLPSHKFYKGPNQSTPGQASANQCSLNLVESAFPFTPEQCQQILALLNNQPRSNLVGNGASQSNLSGIALNAVHLPHSNSWIIDSGATDHMVSSSSILTHITSTCSRTVKLPNGVDVEITHIGRVQLTSDIVLNNVLCVPSFQFNLISVGKLIHDANCLVTFLSNSCLIQDQSSKKMIGAGKLHGGLFLFQSPSVTHPKCLQVVSSSNLWHQRLGHPSHKVPS